MWAHGLGRRPLFTGKTRFYPDANLSSIAVISIVASVGGLETDTRANDDGDDDDTYTHTRAYTRKRMDPLPAHTKDSDVLEGRGLTDWQNSSTNLANFLAFFAKSFMTLEV